VRLSPVATTILVTAVAALAGLAANLLSDVKPNSTATITLAALGTSAVGLIAAAANVRSAKRASERVRASIDSADRQSDFTLLTSQRSGVDASHLYNQVIHDSNLPPEVRYIYAWSRLESAMRGTLRNAGVDDMTGRPMGALIAAFADAEGLTEDDKDRLRVLLQLRNHVVHGASNAPDREHIEQALQELDSYTRLTRNI
jgi:hypothetical protein